MNGMPLGRRVLAVLGAAGLLAACGVSLDARPEIVQSDDLPAVLANTTTSTTLPATSAPPTSAEPTVPDEPTTTTTIEPFETVSVTLFYTRPGTSERVRQVTSRVPGPVVLDDVLALLAAPPPELRDQGLTSAVGTALVRGTELGRIGTLTVDLEADLFDRLTDINKRQAIAQLVLTLTSLSIPGQGGIGSVILTVGGNPISVPLPGAGSTTPGEPVGFADYYGLVEGIPAVPTTTTTTTTTTVPEPDPETTPTDPPPAG